MQPTNKPITKTPLQEQGPGRRSARHSDAMLNPYLNAADNVQGLQQQDHTSVSHDTQSRATTLQRIVTYRFWGCLVRRNRAKCAPRAGAHTDQHQLGQQTYHHKPDHPDSLLLQRLQLLLYVQSCSTAPAHLQDKQNFAVSPVCPIGQAQLLAGEPPQYITCAENVGGQQMQCGRLAAALTLGACEAAGQALHQDCWNAPETRFLCGPVLIRDLWPDLDVAI